MVHICRSKDMTFSNPRNLQKFDLLSWAYAPGKLSGFYESMQYLHVAEQTGSKPAGLCQCHTV